MSIGEDGFKPVSATQRRKGKHGKRAAVNTPFDTQLQRTVAELDTDGWSESVKETLSLSLSSYPTQNIRRIVCLGLGSPANSILSRAQLALLFQLCSILNLHLHDAVIYDPLHSQDDLRILRELGFTVLEEEDVNYHIADTPTFFYMPHCELTLYERVVERNCSNEQLPNVVLLGNRLDEYMQSISERELVSQFPCVKRFASRLSCTPLPPSPIHTNAFNNLAIQYLQGPSLVEPS